jgi:2-aminoadipate transaminase
LDPYGCLVREEQAVIQVERNIGEPVYRQVRERLRELIRSGVLKPGQKLPPTRRLATDLGVNRNTVVSAYEELLGDGLVCSHVGKGTFVAGADASRGGTAEAAPIDFHWPTHLAAPGSAGTFSVMMEDAPAGGVPVRFAFGGGFPPAELYPVAWLKKSLYALLREDGAGVLNYGPVAGLPSLRSLIVQGLRAEGVDASERGLIVTHGAQQALALAIRALVEPGDRVAVEAPTYPGLLSILRERRARLIGIPMEKDGLSLDAAEMICRRHAPRLLCTIPDFHNPTGCVLSLSKRKRLVRLAERYGIPLLEDASFRELRYRGEDLPPLKAFDRAGAVIYVNSVAKKIAPALRIGWAAVHPALADRFVALKAAEDLGTSALCQALLETFLARGHYRSHLRCLRRAYSERLDAMWSAIARYFPPEAQVEKPDGGMFLWVTFPKHVDLMATLAACSSRGLVFSPGPLFYPAEGGRNQMRLSFIAHNPQQIRAGIRILGGMTAAAVCGQNRSGEAPKVPLV